jgi:predicted amidohydrolase
MAAPTRRRFRVAAAQMTSTADVATNLATAERLARRAVREGADLVAFPENFAFLRREGEPLPTGKSLADGPARWAAGLARDLGVWVLAGSVAERARSGRRVHNTSVLVAPDGRFAAVYRKIHLFDAVVPGSGTLRESEVVAPGRKLVVARTPFGRLGLSICYDLRFPELYRALAAKGAEVIFVPSAFTHFTGSHHWEILLRARAIENQAWVVAPAQTGRHGPRRRSWGHTMVIDPWGEVVARRVQGTGVVVADIDLDRVDAVRGAMPCQAHRRL